MAFPTLAHWRTTYARVPRSASPLGEITVAGTIAGSPGIDPKTKRMFGQWALVYLVAGQGRFSDDNHTGRPIGPGQWILVFPEIAHSYGPRPGHEWHEIYVAFRGPIFDLWRRLGHLAPSRPVGQWHRPEVGVRKFAEFFRHLEKKSTSSVEAVCQWQGFLAGIFGDLPVSGQPAWLEKALDLLEHSGPDTETTLPDIARMCGLSYESFRKKFEALVGQPPGHYASARRIEHARRLLSVQDFTNQEMADLLGFYDEFHFSKTFRRFTGQTPRQFRLSRTAP